MAIYARDMTRPDARTPDVL